MPIKLNVLGIGIGAEPKIEARETPSTTAFGVTQKTKPLTKKNARQQQQREGIKKQTERGSLPKLPADGFARKCLIASRWLLTCMAEPKRDPYGILLRNDGPAVNFIRLGTYDTNLSPDDESVRGLVRADEDGYHLSNVRGPVSKADLRETLVVDLEQTLAGKATDAWMEILEHRWLLHSYRHNPVIWDLNKGSVISFTHLDPHEMLYGQCLKSDTNPEGFHLANLVSLAGAEISGARVDELKQDLLRLLQDDFREFGYQLR